MERCSWYIKWKKQATKKNVEDFPTFFVYICTEKRQIHEKILVWFWTVRWLYYFFNSHFLLICIFYTYQILITQYGEKENFWILLPQICLGTYFFLPFFFSVGKGAPLFSTQWERLWSMKAFVFLASLKVLFCWLHHSKLFRVKHGRTAVPDHQQMQNTQGINLDAPEGRRNQSSPWYGAGEVMIVHRLGHHHGPTEEIKGKCPNVTQRLSIL